MLMTQFDRLGWDPFAEMRRLREDMNRLFDDVAEVSASRLSPPVNLWIGDNSVVVTAELPGLTPEDVDLTIREDTLTIRGERKPAAEAEQASWHRRERAYGTFSRTISLPYRVDPDHVQARFRNGVLEVEMQRPEADRPRRIAISSQ
ncbi:Hsp20/alpha crystallin family protein [Chelativorans intermedius]|uniref:Hsp20/alpha crystallin family protein n=1 Tax=Chelativorans intermedius TaxID=515947 RepID=A0ABV6D4F6_9HYPH|nr:Hsp20/alpha crystallin family protein [Chelativorans intermedius]MCT8997580.1 Hsp20/alpha crystallin family protein [Chelativorans intermedius]